MPATTTEDEPVELNLKQVAAHLGVHYMTAYRYVRQGRLPARQVGTGWRVSAVDLERFVHPDAGVAAGPTDWPGRLGATLLRGDPTAAWAVVDDALAAGVDPTSCALDVIGGALADIDRREQAGEIGPSQYPVAIQIAHRLSALLGARFRRPGRSRGTVVFGAPSGERHDLPIAIVSDVVRLAGFDVLELGADIAPDAFVDAAARSTRLVAVGLGVTGVGHLDAARATIAALRLAQPGTPILVGGQAVLNPEVAAVLDADVWAADGRAAVAALVALAERRG